MAKPTSEDLRHWLDEALVCADTGISPELERKVRDEIRRRVEAFPRLVAALEEANGVLGSVFVGDDAVIEAGVTSARIDALLDECRGDTPEEEPDDGRTNDD